jgi:CubicO group peptidase (beta-lactamase class C family)
MACDPISLNLSRRAVLSRSLLAGAGAALAGTPLGRLAAQDNPASRWPALAAMAHDYVANGTVANMIAYVGFSQRASAVGEGFDTLGGPRKSDGDSLYRLYSMTKPITGMAAMMLVDEGKLSLDQPLAEIIPAFANMQVQKQYDGSIGPENLEPAQRPILIRNLITHTSGLGYSIIQSGPIADKMREIGVVSGRVSRVALPGFDRGKSTDSLAHFAELLATLPLVYQPGTRWSYSTGMDLTGRVIEVASGQSFDSFLKERIFDPCGMSSTWFQVPQSEIGRLTTNYGVVNGELIAIDRPETSVYLDPPAFPMGGSGLVSSPRDYDRFLHMVGGYGMLDGKRVMSEAAVKTGTSNLLPPGDGVTKGTSIEGYGFGAGGRVGGSGGRNNYGWAGAAGTIGFVDMRRGLRGGLFTQYMPAEDYPLDKAFPAAVALDVVSRKAAA